MTSFDECTCDVTGSLCEPCRASAITVAVAAAGVCHGNARAVNEIEHEDPHSNRVFKLRRALDGQWYVADVRPMGNIERGRCRPQPSSA